MEEFIKQWGILITFLGLLGIEISPIKVNPLRWLFRAIGNLLNGELIHKIDTLSEKVNKLERHNDFKDLLDIKNNLSNYHVMLATTGLDENQYRRCFELEEKYNYYKDKYPGEVNGHMDALLEAIHESYRKGKILDLKNRNNQ